MTNQAILSIIEKYRRLLYFVHGQPTRGLMSKGLPCYVEDPTSSTTHCDVVHPCIRYIEKGFEGHKWWMVYTPYYNGNDSLENPRICYADSEEGNPPTKWFFYCYIKDTPLSGYNSDPTMLFLDGNLYVFWRECETPSTKRIGCKYATFGCTIHNKTVTQFPEPLLASGFCNEDPSIDKEVCPSFMVINKELRAYAMHFDFVPKFIHYIPSKLGSFMYRHSLFFFFDALGIFKHEKNDGVAIWKGNSFEQRFVYTKTVKFSRVSRLYQPWHMDLFKDDTENDGKIYAVVQSSMRFADICLAWSDDGEHFHFCKRQLLTSQSIGSYGIYKPSALIHNNRLYLYYTVRDSHNYHLNRMFISSYNWSDLKRALFI